MQSNVDVNLNVLHTIGGLSEFNRKKWITVHSSITEPDWNGEADKLNYLINDLDVHFARDTGGLTYNVLNYTPEQMVSVGRNSRNEYAQRNDLHQYENNQQELIVGGQARLVENTSGTEAGRRTAAYLNNYFGSGGTDGVPQPQYVELLNEPLWPLHDVAPAGQKKSIKEIFDYHFDMATAIKANAPEAKIGGYVTAFPNFREDNFNRWNERWKTYIDRMGNLTDFYSIHLYDFPTYGRNISGAYNEATLDMMQHYGELTNKDRPVVISEYGGLVTGSWSPQRDWDHIQSMNSMMLQFMERPDQIAKALPFNPIKAEWGGENYGHRMMRKANEPNSYTGNWEWTEFIKFYELWDDVNGSRVDSVDNNINIQTDAYVDGNRAYVILNSLSTDVEQVNLNLNGVDNNAVQSVKIRNLFKNAQGAPELTVSNHTFDLNSTMELKPGATIIAEYTFKNDVFIDETSKETKYYADKYLQSISANTTNSFKINGVTDSIEGEAILKIGVGRDDNRSLNPLIQVNGTKINSPVEYRGDDQQTIDGFFGVLEVEVPYNLIQANNTVNITFPDNGGHISSLAMQVFNFSDDIRGKNLDSTSNPTISAPLEAIRINAGGEAFTDSNGNSWMADKYFQGGNTYSTNAGIDQTQDDTLFQSERYAKDLSYAIPVGNGNYKVNLNFAEIHWNQNTQRMFDAKVENQLVLDNFDIHQGVGGKNIATEKSFDVNVQDGVLNLDFSTTANYAKISSIEILPV